MKHSESFPQDTKELYMPESLVAQYDKDPLRMDAWRKLALRIVSTFPKQSANPVDPNPNNTEKAVLVEAIDFSKACG